MLDVLHNGKPAIVLHVKYEPFSGVMLAIQYTKPCGEPYTLSERKAAGIAQYVFVKPEEVKECAEA